jgi:predicted Zn-dependent peptidase
MKFNYAFPPMDEFVLDNGLKLLLVPDHEQNGLVFALQLAAGRFTDPIGFEGLCEVTAALLTKGTKSFSPDEFSSLFENAGATLFSDVGEEHIVLGMRLLVPAVQQLLPLFVEMIASPRFAQEEYTRLLREMVTALQAEAVDTASLASRHFYGELAGNAHPAGRPQTMESLRNISMPEVKDFFGSFFVPRGSVCVIAGDFEFAKMKRFAVEQFSFWKRSGDVKGVIAGQVPPSNAKKPAIRLVNKPDVTQVSLAVGRASPGERCPAKNALLLANYIFGGGNFSSRLMTRIRTGDGKTYGIASQLLTETEFGAFLITTSTRNAELKDVLSSILDEYRRFYAHGVTAEELEKAKQFAIGNMAFQLEGIGNVVDKLLWLRFYGRPDSYIERFEEMIAAIDVATVNDAVTKYLSPENLVIVAVGKKAEVLPQLSSFGDVRQFNFRDKV